MSTLGDMAYVAIKPCGCVVLAVADKPHVLEDFADDLAGCLRDGLRVEHVTSDWVRATSCWSCETCAEPTQEALPL